jgi:hypothetical protein
MPGHPWLPAVTVALYLAILAILVGTQPQLALGAGAMIAAIFIAGFFTARRNGG